MHPVKILIPMLSIASALILLMGSGCGPNPSHERSSDKQPSEEVGATSTLKTLGIKRMSLRKFECDDLVRDFGSHIVIKGVPPIAIGGVEQEIPWAAVAELAPPAMTPAPYGVIFHYGRRGNDFVIALSKVGLKRDGATAFKYDHKDMDVRVLNGLRLDPPIKYADWLKDYVTGKYFGGTPPIQVRRNDATSTFDDLDPARDPMQDMMPYELEVERLYLENLPIPGFSAVLVMRCISEYDGVAGSYVHKIALHIRHRSTTNPAVFYDRLIHDEPIKDREFENHGANLGNLCPPNSNCGRYAVQPAKLLDYLKSDSTSTR